MKHMLILIGIGTGAGYLLHQYVIKDDESDPGFIQSTPGLGLDDVVLYGGTALLANWAAKMVRF